MANLQLISNLKAYRDAHGYTQDGLSQLLSISRQAYSNYECGKRDPDLGLLIQLCGIYNITLDQLIHQPFHSHNMLIRESKAPYAAAKEIETNNELYLTHEEITFLLKFREADQETRNVIVRLLGQN